MTDNADRALTALPRKPKGILSLLYWVQNDPEFNRAFHQNEILVMKKYFGITDENLMGLIVQIGEAHEHPDDAKVLFMQLCDEYLFNELLTNNPPFW